MFTIKLWLYNFFSIFSYYAIELCRYSVKELIKNQNMYSGVLSILTPLKIMHQTTLGLDYLHGLPGNPIHRNIHGKNVLVAEIPSKSGITHYIVRLSDFRWGKKIEKKDDENQSKSLPTSYWFAPEMLIKGRTLGPWTDIFILGCFFYFVLSGGKHPFGKKFQREKNIKEGKSGLDECGSPTELSTKKFIDLIKEMTKNESSERTKMSRILQHFQNDAGYFPLYDDKYIKPGRCVIINQQVFPKMSKVRI